MSTWRDAPDASGLWWRDWGNRRFDVVDVTVDESDGDVWFRDEDGDYIHISKHRPVRWCRVVTPERVEALESALRSVIDNEADTTTPWCARCGVAWDDPYHDEDGRCHIGRAIAVLRGATTAGERGSRG